MSKNYDVQQVCENGHQITGCYNLCPDDRKDFCQECGEPTITACPSCKKEIQGDMLGEDWHGEWNSIASSAVPSYCHNCGKSYPWTESKIVAAIQVFAELGVAKNTIDEDIHNIAKDIPQAKPSAMRIKRICDKYGPVAYNVVMEFASKTAAEILKG